MHAGERLCPLYSKGVKIPKLDVTASSDFKSHPESAGPGAQQPLYCAQKCAQNSIPAICGGFANRQSRWMVSADTWRISAVSSTLRPPKKRSSTIRDFRASSCSIAFNASSSAVQSGLGFRALRGLSRTSPESLRRCVWRCGANARSPPGYGASTERRWQKSAPGRASGRGPSNQCCQS
jgi:hypothetical protein